MYMYILYYCFYGNQIVFIYSVISTEVRINLKCLKTIYLYNIIHKSNETPVMYVFVFQGSCFGAVWVACTSRPCTTAREMTYASFTST